MSTSCEEVMHKEDIRAGIRKSFGTLEKAAAEYGVCRQFVTSVMKGEKRSARVERAIAETLGKSVEEVFPERYPLRVSDAERLEAVNEL
ncbi:MAG: transcriptional regulator [Synechococcaceae cyanobacterium SM2_3_2]|nr:transcriptional regulator [Synechococcaceae cyanobacterium SM2_3_2]